MSRKVVLLRICYWLGAILDARAAVLLTLLRYREMPAGIWGHQSAHAFGMQALWAGGDASALMWGWTVLLIWADRKPVERRGVLLLTAVPVIPAILLNMLHQWTGGFVPFAQIAPWFFFLLGVMSLFAFSYFYASEAKKAEPIPAAR